eukprot:3931919-Rhodomonas_salina.1
MELQQFYAQAFVTNVEDLSAIIDERRATASFRGTGLGRAAWQHSTCRPTPAWTAVCFEQKTCISCSLK